MEMFRDIIQITGLMTVLLLISLLLEFLADILDEKYSQGIWTVPFMIASFIWWIFRICSVPLWFLFHFFSDWEAGNRIDKERNDWEKLEEIKRQLYFDKGKEQGYAEGKSDGIFIGKRDAQKAGEFRKNAEAFNRQPDECNQETVCRGLDGSLSAQHRLISALTQLLSSSQEHVESLRGFVSLFADSVLANGAVSIEDIDAFIDWIFLSGFFVPDFNQYRQLGLNIVLSHKIFVSASTQSRFQDWDAIRREAIDSGILLSSQKSYPSIELWNTELSSFLPMLFVPGDSDLCSILERIIQVAQEGLMDDASIPEHIARMAQLPHRAERDTIDEVSAKVEFHLRIFARELSLPAEQKPSDPLKAMKRVAHCGKRIDIVRNYRKQLLLSEQFPERGRYVQHST